MIIDYTTWSGPDLEKELAAIQSEIDRREKSVDATVVRELNINGITTMDFIVIYYKEEKRTHFSFYIEYNNDIHDINEGGYTGERNKKGRAMFYPWWPTASSGTENAALAFVPMGFLEMCENLYEYGGSDEEAFAMLQESGFTNIIQATLEDCRNAEYSEVYKAWKLTNP